MLDRGTRTLSRPITRRRPDSRGAGHTPRKLPRLAASNLPLHRRRFSGAARPKSFYRIAKDGYNVNRNFQKFVRIFWRSFVYSDEKASDARDTGPSGPAAEHLDKWICSKPGWGCWKPDLARWNPGSAGWSAMSGPWTRKSTSFAMMKKITRIGVNSLLEWADEVSLASGFPLPRVGVQKDAQA